MILKSKSSQYSILRTLQYVFCILLSIIVLFPVYMGIFGGFKSNGQLLSDPVGFPRPMYLQNYGNILKQTIGKFWEALGNSLIVAGGTVGITLVVCVMAAFAISRIKFRSAGFFRNYFLLGLLFPLAVAILPLYLQIRNLKLIDKYLGVILPQVAFQIPMTVLLLIGFFRGIPQDLEDACEIDGYGPLGFLVKMVIPLSTPILATTAVIILVASWNNFFLPLLVFNTEQFYTLPMGVMNFQGQHASDWNMILAYLSLAMVPAIILFISAQKYIVAGLTGGAVKG
jgi:raffinose/stachyose/melibiose transport system permease protein